ncbi:MAG: cytochrome c family protein [Candidatus Aminicenantes bacterium]|nr:cytochrome c family protein [Candidatus Aminicenantes bacterium]
MKKLIFVLTLAVACVCLANLFAQEFTYVGSAKCKMCHQTEAQGLQFPIWEGTAHAKTFEQLSSDAGKALAADAPENAKCLKCHAPLAEFKAEGVSCEVCHGPGSDYKSMTVMKDHAGSVAKGLIEYGSPDAIKKQCAGCHENNPHDESFDFDAAWAKIKHIKPDAK